MQRAAWKAGVLGSITVLFAVLNARLILLIAILGLIWLTYVGRNDGDPVHLIQLALLAAVVGALILLAGRK